MKSAWSRQSGSCCWIENFPGASCPGSSWIARCVFAAYPNTTVQHARMQRFNHAPEPQFKYPAQRVSPGGPPVRKAQLARKAKRGDNNGPDNAILEQPVNP